MSAARFSPAGKVVIVTGAASGIGAQLARTLAELGAQVVALDMAPVEAEAAHVITMSVTDEAAWHGAARQVLERFGRIDGLVNCAGIIRMGAVTEMPVDDLRAMLDVNVVGPFLGMKHVLPAMVAQGSGSIVNISSIAGLVGSPGASGYCASKGAVKLMTKAAALEAIGAAPGVRVNSIHPSLIATAMAQDIIDQVGGGDETRDALLATMPGGDFIPVQGVVDTIVFLLCDASANVNGAEVVVDNGYTAQ